MSEDKSKGNDPKIILMDMPEVKDIPGQENVHPPRLREMGDTTISSSDEEGEGILDELNADPSDSDDEILAGPSNVDGQEKQLLQQTDRAANDDAANPDKLKSDDSDADDSLNEGTDALNFGTIPDVPGARANAGREELPRDSEENNP